MLYFFTFWEMESIFWTTGERQPYDNLTYYTYAYNKSLRQDCDKVLMTDSSITFMGTLEKNHN